MGTLCWPYEDGFSLVGTKPGTYQSVLDIGCPDSDLNETSFKMSLFRSIWPALEGNVVSDKLAVCCSAGIESIANVDVKLLDCLFKAPVLRHEIFEKDRTCPICRERFGQGDDVIVTECQHLFHQSCCLRWALQLIGKESCACCRGSTERLYFGTYDKHRENIDARKIRVISAISGKFNKWKVAQFEYCECSEHISPEWNCKRAILDRREWYIDGGQFFVPSEPLPWSNFIPHPISSRQKDWNAWNNSPTYKNIVEIRRNYHQWKQHMTTHYLNARNFTIDSNGMLPFSHSLFMNLTSALQAEPSILGYWLPEQENSQRPAFPYHPCPCLEEIIICRAYGIANRQPALINGAECHDRQPMAPNKSKTSSKTRSKQALDHLFTSLS